jgi:hypothetical protein
MCLLGWLNHSCVRFQREVAVPFPTTTGHPLQLSTSTINSKPACISLFVQMFLARNNEDRHLRIHSFQLMMMNW